MAINLGGKPVGEDWTKSDPKRIKFVGTTEAVSGKEIDDLYYWVDGQMLSICRAFNGAPQFGRAELVLSFYPKDDEKVMTNGGKYVTMDELELDPYVGELWTYVRHLPGVPRKGDA